MWCVIEFIIYYIMGFYVIKKPTTKTRSEKVSSTISVI